MNSISLMVMPLLRCLLQLEDSLRNIKDKDIKVYALVNCGFYEGKQNKLAIVDILFL